MIYFPKTADARLQPILDEARSGDRESAYRSGLVLDCLMADFYHKCYLCEDKPTTFHIEHFEPHRGDMDKKY